jgi:3-hydroxybutyryl-CoA dehydrogenase
MADIRSILVVGAGTMGNGIAHVAAQYGYAVTLADVSSEQLDRALATIRTNLERQAKKGAIAENDIPDILGRIATTTDAASAAAKADFAIEAASENFDVKRSVFRTLDEYAPSHCILATNTSSISITTIAATTSRADRVIGMHFFNPVPVMKLCEIVRGQATSDETFAATFALAQALGKTPVTVQDYPGFVSNRILMPMINEAVYCLMEGVASAEDIDTVMKLGMNHPMGPLQLADFIGLDVCLAIMEVLHEGLGDDKYRPCPLLRRMVAAGYLGRKTGRGFYTYQ